MPAVVCVGGPYVVDVDHAALSWWCQSMLVVAMVSAVFQVTHGCARPVGRISHQV